MKQKMYYYIRIKSNSFGKWFWQVEVNKHLRKQMYIKDEVKSISKLISSPLLITLLKYNATKSNIKRYYKHTSKKYQFLLKWFIYSHAGLDEIYTKYNEGELTTKELEEIIKLAILTLKV